MKFRIFIVSILLLLPFHSTFAADPNIYTAVLQEFVKDENVQYRRLCKDARLEESIQQLKSVNPDQIASDQDRLAFWINVYNAHTLKIICDNYPVKSINDLHTGGLVLGTVLNRTVWDREFVIIHDQKYTLNQIEHKIIRPVYKDPRAHFALVCASKSCPNLRTEAYAGSRLDQQLNEDARNFLSDPSKNRFDVNQKKAFLSKIFDWYGKDFGKDKDEILNRLTPYLAPDIAASIRSDPSKWKVEYLDYDWSLNE
jgi:hypothetical protein